MHRFMTDERLLGKFIILRMLIMDAVLNSHATLSHSEFAKTSSEISIYNAGKVVSKGQTYNSFPASPTISLRIGLTDAPLSTARNKWGGFSKLYKKILLPRAQCI